MLFQSSPVDQAERERSRSYSIHYIPGSCDNKKNGMNNLRLNLESMYMFLVVCNIHYFYGIGMTMDIRSSHRFHINCTYRIDSIPL